MVCKELLCQLLAAPADRDEISLLLWRFSTKPAPTRTSFETTRLVTTVQTWWPAVLVALHTGVRTPDRWPRPDHQQVNRVGCGFRSMEHYRRRIPARIAFIRPRRPGSMNRAAPLKIRAAVDIAGSSQSKVELGSEAAGLEQLIGRCSG
jgi:hypothetical protein